MKPDGAKKFGFLHVLRCRLCHQGKLLFSKHKHYADIYIVNIEILDGWGSVWAYFFIIFYFMFVDCFTATLVENWF
jgi:hypothetical protein